MQENNDSYDRPNVIVRSWGDEPITLKLYRIENNRCYVGKSGASRPIGLPVDQVFAFDMDRFTLLSTAFQQGNISKLGEFWANIPVDDFACNKYQDVLGLLHDQEDIANPECVTSGHEQ